MTPPALVLLHSPLVGPRTVEPLADALRRHGRTVVVPRMHHVGFAGARQWSSWVRAATEQIGDAHADSVVLVGHSGAGPLLPILAERLRGPVAGLVFIDAGLPPPDGQMAVAPRDLRNHLRTIAVDGVLPPWSEWWGSDAMGRLIPDAQDRVAVVAELPRVPLAFFDAIVTMPGGWDERCPVAYVRLSAAYDDDAERARARGFPVCVFEGAHLDTVARADELGTIIDRIVAELVPPTK